MLKADLLTANIKIAKGKHDFEKELRAEIALQIGNLTTEKQKLEQENKHLWHAIEKL